MLRALFWCILVIKLTALGAYPAHESLYEAVYGKEYRLPKAESFAARSASSSTQDYHQGEQAPSVWQQIKKAIQGVFGS